MQIGWLFTPLIRWYTAWYMGGIDGRDDETYLEDVRRLKKTILNLLDWKKKPEEVPAPVRNGKVVTIAPSLVESKPPKPRSRLSIIASGAGRDIRLLADLPDLEIIKIAKKGGRLLRAGDVAKVRASAGKNGVAADVIDAMDTNGMFDS